MNHTRLDATDDGRVIVSGPLTFETVGDLLRASKYLFQTGRRLQFDFERTRECDSAAVALLIEWWRLAEQAGCVVQFQALPASLIAIARLSEVEQLLPLTE